MKIVRSNKRPKKSKLSQNIDEITKGLPAEARLGIGIIARRTHKKSNQEIERKREKKPKGG